MENFKCPRMYEISSPSIHSLSKHSHTFSFPLYPTATSILFVINEQLQYLHSLLSLTHINLQPLHLLSNFHHNKKQYLLRMDSTAAIPVSADANGAASTNVAASADSLDVAQGRQTSGTALPPPKPRKSGGASNGASKKAQGAAAGGASRRTVSRLAYLRLYTVIHLYLLFCNISDVNESLHQLDCFLFVLCRKSKYPCLLPTQATLN